MKTKKIECDCKYIENKSIGKCLQCYEKEINTNCHHCKNEMVISKFINILVKKIKLLQKELDNHISETNREEALLWGRIVMIEQLLEKHCGKDSGHQQNNED